MFFLSAMKDNKAQIDCCSTPGSISMDVVLFTAEFVHLFICNFSYEMKFDQKVFSQHWVVTKELLNV